MGGRAGERGLGEHAADATDAGATDYAHKDGLGLVIGGVTGGDARGVFAASDKPEELIAHAAGCFFQALAAFGRGLADVTFAGDAFDVEGLREGPGPCHFGLGAGAELMVEVDGYDFEAEAGPKRLEDEEEGERVGAAGEGSENPGGAAEQPFFRGKALDREDGGIEERMRISAGRAAPTSGPGPGLLLRAEG